MAGAGLVDPGNHESLTRQTDGKSSGVGLSEFYWNEQLVPFTSFFALLSPWWLITAAVQRKFSGFGLLTGFRLWPPFPWLSSCLDFWSAQWRLMSVVYGDLRHGAAVTIKESSA